jgi:hypothetical protein
LIDQETVMNTSQRLLRSAMAVSLAIAAASIAQSQTTSPRNLQAPTQAELLAACQKQSVSDRASCEKRVRENGIPSEGSRNKSAEQQQAEKPAVQRRSIEDPGASTTPPEPSTAQDSAARTRQDRTRMSQRSEDIKNRPAPRTEPNATNSTDAAPTKVEPTRQGNQAADQSTSDRTKRDGPQERAQSKPQENQPDRK